MKKFGLQAFIVGAGLMAVACGGGNHIPPGIGGVGGGGGNPSGSPVYVTNINSASISAYLINQTSGALQRISGSPFSTGRSSPDSVVVDPGKKFLAVANSSAASTSVFGINTSSAVLTAVLGSPFTAQANEARLAMHPSGKFLYGLSNTPAQIDGYNFDSTTGAISQLSGFPVSLSGSGEMGLTVSPNGTFLYTSNPSTNQITSFAIANNGAITKLGTTSPPKGSPGFLTFDTSGNFLFAINRGGALGGGSVSAFNVSLTGGLAEVAGSPFTAGSTPVSATFSNGVLYVVNQTSSNLSAFALNASTGQLTEIKGSPYPLGTGPVSVSPAVRGNFLIATNSASGTGGTISVFAVATDGTLTPVAGSPFTPDTPTPNQVIAF